MDEFKDENVYEEEREYIVDGKAQTVSVEVPIKIKVKEINVTIEDENGNITVLPYKGIVEFELKSDQNGFEIYAKGRNWSL